MINETDRPATAPAGPHDQLPPEPTPGTPDRPPAGSEPHGGLLDLLPGEPADPDPELPDPDPDPEPAGSGSTTYTPPEVLVELAELSDGTFQLGDGSNFPNDKVLRVGFVPLDDLIIGSDGEIITYRLPNRVDPLNPIGPDAYDETPSREPLPPLEYFLPWDGKGTYTLAQLYRDGSLRNYPKVEPATNPSGAKGTLEDFAKLINEVGAAIENGRRTTPELFLSFTRRARNDPEDRALIRTWGDNLESAVRQVYDYIEEATASNADDKPSRRVDLTPYLDGTHNPPEPAIGARREDLEYMLYPGKWHTCIGPAETYKSMFALWHAAEVMSAGGSVAYLHFEEDEPSDTIERLRNMSATDELLANNFIWLDASAPVTDGELGNELGKLDRVPELVILDGINDFCSIHGVDPEKPPSLALYQLLCVKPATKLGCAVLSLGHPVKDPNKKYERYGFGYAGWLNSVNGVAFRMAVNGVSPPARDRNGYVDLYVVKDRPGKVKRNGVPQPRAAGWWNYGSLEVDNSDSTTLGLRLLVPSAATGTGNISDSASASDAKYDDMVERVYDAAKALIGSTGEPQSSNSIASAAKMKKANVTQPLESLVQSGRLERSTGSRGAHLHRLPGA